MQEHATFLLLELLPLHFLLPLPPPPLPLSSYAPLEQFQRVAGGIVVQTEHSDSVSPPPSLTHTQQLSLEGKRGKESVEEGHLCVASAFYYDNVSAPLRLMVLKRLHRIHTSALCQMGKRRQSNQQRKQQRSQMPWECPLPVKPMTSTPVALLSRGLTFTDA